MPNDEKPQIPPGWVGGFAGTDLKTLDMKKNMDNIDKLERQQAIPWPEFSWETEPGSRDSKRCFQMFAPDISRVGYTNEGRVYSIICPQQGIETPSLGSINVEVTVTGQRGWVDENTRELCCDMSVEGRVWFAPGYHEKPAVKLLWKLLHELGHDFPISKDKAIVVGTHRPGEPGQPIFGLTTGESLRFAAPDFARHPEEAWSVGHIDVEIGPIEPTHHTVVNDFNRLLLDILNMSSGNMLKQGNVLTWNVWFKYPEHVDQNEWRDHAEKWRKSIDVDQTSPARRRTPPRFHGGAMFHAADELVEEEVSKIYDFMSKHLSPQQRLIRLGKSVARSLHLLPKSLGG
jgi:hypothetical protein